jgi:hypothetical protein
MKSLVGFVVIEIMTTMFANAAVVKRAPQSSTATNNTAAIYNNTGAIYANSGNIYNNAGQVHENSGNIYNNTGQIQENSGNIYNTGNQLNSNNNSTNSGNSTTSPTNSTTSSTNSTTPVSSDNSTTPVSSDNSTTPVSSDNSTTPVSSDNSTTPVSSDNSTTPVSSDNSTTPVSSDNSTNNCCRPMMNDCSTTTPVPLPMPPVDTSYDTNIMVRSIMPAYGIYTQYKGRNSGKCLKIEGRGTDDGAKLQLWRCIDDDSEKFMYNPFTQELKVKSSGKCLDLVRNDYKNRIQQTQCTRDPGQKWAYDNGLFKNMASGKCLNVERDSKEDGTHIIMYDCNAYGNMQWDIYVKM